MMKAFMKPGMMAMKPIKKAAMNGVVCSLSCSYQGMESQMESSIHAVDTETVMMNFQRIVM